MSRQASTSKEQQKPPLFSHVFGSRKISLSSSVSPTIILGGGGGEANQLKIARNHFSSSSSSSAAAVLISENADLLNEIFLRLPPKSLLRFQCVSKLWLSAISNPNFRRLHCRRFPTSSDADTSALFFIPNTASQAHFIALSEEDVKPIGTLSSGLSKFLDKGICHIHYCNGLFCLKSSVPIDQGEVIVYNPSTNIYRRIPDSKIAKYIKPEDIAINITYDPLISDHYKLVCVWRWIKPDRSVELQFVVYSSETRIWREIKDARLSSNEQFQFQSGVFCNRKLHWLKRINNGYGKQILCFDLDKERINLFAPSLPENNMSELLYFGESEGSLYAIVGSYHQDVLDVLELEKDYSNWILKFRIDLTPLHIMYPSMINIRLNHSLFYSFRIPCLLVSKRRL
ncbi:hypothetical protein M9H77_00915 [Catharanthus roseus]|uniref:Uncharacterized protein n=1 Tax=Catharanthus roseus TaxID=4058 RepID=A0ACC0C421_CATRO|nr:hypothetical protein M9H77_00915 [Catharanthus roseus]